MRADHVHLTLLRIAQILGRLQPFGHGRAVRQIHLLDGGRIHLDAARGCVQRILHRIGAEIRMSNPAIGRCRGGEGDFAFLPEILEGHELRGRTVLVGGLDVIHRLQPFGESQLHAAQFGQPTEDLEIVQRITLRRDDLLHRVELVDVVGAARGDVVALHRRGGGQNDVRPARGSRPPAVLHHHRVHLLQRTDQLVQVLLVRHEVVAGVVDQLHLRIGVAAAVVGELLAGVVQHLGNARGRADLLDRIAALRKPRGRCGARLRRAAATIVPGKAHTLARQANVAQHAGKVHDGPIRHLAMVRALDGPGARQLPDARGRNARDAAGPFRRLGRRAVCVLAFQIGAETVEAHRVLLHEITVPAIRHQQMMAHGQEECRVRVRNDRHPFRVHHLIGRGALRIDGNALHAGLADGLPVREHLVIGHRVFDAVVLVRIAADEHQHLGVLGHLFPAGLGRIHLQVTQHQRHDDLACTCRVVTRRHG